MPKGRKEGREVVINGFSVLEFCKADHLTGVPSHRIRHEDGSCSFRPSVADNSPTDSNERYNIPPQGIPCVEMCTNRL